MEVLRTKYFELEKQRAEIDQEMMAIQLKFKSEGLSIEERDNKPNIETLVTDTDADMDRLWELRNQKRNIYQQEYKFDKSGASLLNSTEFKNPEFMKKTLLAHQARKAAEAKANIFK